ncbi:MULTISPECIES: HNH endonuclease signature motif containing protein [Streptomyces]|uniref:HNH endonuclease n=2 Tax=Streptomyces rimosus subsp. rimosus TaxID=132474 RepID=L8EYW6_STRR1|nr:MULTISPECIES: HNH endonuclease signature motif containing protein [Streptomyces]MYT47342.1 HNH endonuclease [Streptomyces sp. SID5471]KEF04672.1 hypothetical protein DF17_22555 [Streptomyces rimosus]QDA06250.1 HNH endonuclease [Streptomyces rimosus]QEV77526.1 HNH endonuclease [Streptomyces rimosus]QGY64793.1 HNH endonuclease [Streptomyces rimosus R6-500]
MTKPLAERFWSKVRVANTLHDCWSWLGACTPTGYGNVYDGARTEKAHRVAYMLTFGKIPNGYEIDHLCHRRGCVNPWHLRAIAHAENLRSSRPATATHCPHGHAYTGHRQRNGRRECHVCRKIRESRRVRHSHQGAAA